MHNTNLVWRVFALAFCLCVHTKKHYSECEDLDVHGGVTFSEIGKIFKTKIEDDLELPDDAWVLGIDFNSVLGEWDIKDVEKELKRFINEVIKANK